MGSKPSTTPLIVIVGETASGKTAASIKLAQIIGGEIICADSRTIYKQMDIGTAKPTDKEQKLVPHHLISILNPDQKFSAAQFQRRAQKCIQEIHERGKFPIVVGGTGLYVDALLYNFQFVNKPDEQLRAQLEQMSDEELTTVLHTKNIDSTTLNTKNRRHVIRAIEREGEAPINKMLRKNTLVLGLTLEREVLKDRIANRTEQMFNNGFIAEIKKLSDQYGWENESTSGAAYDVAREHLEGNISEQAAKEAFIKRDTSLAKRQRTWFKRNKSIQWFSDAELLIAKAVEFKQHLHYN